MTADPKWDEITQELLPGQQASDRPDLVSCVFCEKVRILLKEIKKESWVNSKEMCIP